MKKTINFKKIAKKNGDFWGLFHENDQKTYLEKLKHGRFLDNPLQMNPKTSALLIYSYSKKIPQIPDQCTQDQLLKLYNFHKNAMNQLDFVNVIWAFSKLCPENTALFQELERKILDYKENQLNVREKITIIHSFSKAGQGSEPFWGLQEEFLNRNINFLLEKELSIVAWALNKRKKLNNPVLWEKIESRILSINLTDVEFISGLIHSFGKAGKGSDKLWNEFERIFSSNIQNIKTRYFSNVCWAFAKSSKTFQNPLLIDYIEKWVGDELRKDQSVRDLLTVLWACNKMNKPDQPEFWFKVFKNFEERKEKVSYMNNQDLLNFSWILMQRMGHTGFSILWENLRKKFRGFLEEKLQEMKEGTFKEQDFIVKSHECFYLGEGAYDLWQVVGEKVYLEYLRSNKNFDQNENIKEISILASKFDRVPRSEDFKNLTNLLKLMNHRDKK